MSCMACNQLSHSLDDTVVTGLYNMQASELRHLTPEQLSHPVDRQGAKVVAPFSLLLLPHEKRLLIEFPKTGSGQTQGHHLIEHKGVCFSHT
jgi:hypothetical protein